MKGELLRALRYHTEFVPGDDTEWDDYDYLVYRGMRSSLRRWLETIPSGQLADAIDILMSEEIDDEISL